MNAGTGGSGDRHESELSDLWHDVRGVLAAACTNADYLARMADIPEPALEVAREIENELRLAADVIELVTSERQLDQRVELDLRALLWFTRRGSHRVIVDATLPPFPVRGDLRRLQLLADAINAAAAPRAAMERIAPTNPASPEPNEVVRICGLDPAAVDALVRTALPGVDLRLSTPSPGTLELTRLSSAQS